MSVEDLVHTLHPLPAKEGVRISKAKYDRVKEAILRNLLARGPLTFNELGNLVEDELQVHFDGSARWYYTTVKLDLEARGMIRRVPKSKPQLIERVE